MWFAWNRISCGKPHLAHRAALGYPGNGFGNGAGYVSEYGAGNCFEICFKINKNSHTILELSWWTLLFSNFSLWELSGDYSLECASSRSVNRRLSAKVTVASAFSSVTEVLSEFLQPLAGSSSILTGWSAYERRLKDRNRKSINCHRTACLSTEDALVVVCSMLGTLEIYSRLRFRMSKVRPNSPNISARS